MTATMLLPHRLSWWLKLLASVLLFAFAGLSAGQNLVAVPTLRARVTDLTNTLSNNQIAALDRQLSQFEDRKGVQIAVLMVSTTQPEAIEQFALRVAEQWKLGRRKVDDGALFLIAKDDRTMRIEVGYGLEGALSDVVANRIIDEYVKPRFRQGDFDGGVAAAVDQMIRVIDGESLPPPVRVRRTPNADQPTPGLPLLILVALALGGILRRVMGRLPGALIVGGVLGLLSWFVLGTLVMAAVSAFMGFIVTLLGLRIGGHHGHHYGSGWGGGGGGGGGFGGGGGGFGGGGASGRW